MEGLVATADASPIELQPTMEDPISNPAQAVGRAPIRNTKLRVANAFKRIRARRAQTNAENEKQPLPPALFRLDEGCRSDVSGITDVGDDLSWYGGDGDSHHRTQRISRSLTPKFPTKTSTDPSFPESIETWRDALSSLVQSKEMEAFVNSSNKLATSAAHKSIETAKNVTEIAVHTVLLPVTLPLHVTASATGLVFDTGSKTLHYFCDNLVPIVINQAMLAKQGRLKDGSEKTVTLELPKEKQAKNNKMKYQHDKSLDRLLLDVRQPSETSGIEEAVFCVETDSLTLKLKASAAKLANSSKFLLRVEDVNVTCNDVRVFVVDLKKESADEKLTRDALSQLSQRSVDITLSNEFVKNMLPEQIREQSGSANKIAASWKPIGQTKQDYNRLQKLSQKEYYDALRGRCCIWVGKYLGEKYHGSENPFFMAQGVVDASPDEIFNILWDSNRTKDYNKHCVNRQDVLVVDNSEKNKAKIIESETKIPFTSMTVHLSALMCSKSLGNDGVVIFSRSLGKGPAKYHSSQTAGQVKSSKNEVILGVNILRPVPGRPDLCDLISVSQVDASILPPFLKSRVGTFAVEDFFKNIRACFPKKDD